MKIIAVDPGLRMGYAKFTNGDLEDMGVAEGFHEIFSTIKDFYADVFVVERYRIRPPAKSGWAHQWVEPPALKVIGAIEFRIWDITSDLLTPKLVMQESNKLELGCKFAGIPYDKKKHLDDRLSAVAHGVFWWRTQGEAEWQQRMN